MGLFAYAQSVFLCFFNSLILRFLDSLLLHLYILGITALPTSFRWCPPVCLLLPLVLTSIVNLYIYGSAGSISMAECYTSHDMSGKLSAFSSEIYPIAVPLIY